MQRSELEELHYITPIANLKSIQERGIVSHIAAQGIPHDSVALQGVQDRRSNKRVPPHNQRLHDFVNLYIHARNPMMYLRRNEHETLSVLRISTAVLDLPGSIVTDANASSDYVRFAPSPQGLDIVDRDLAFAHSWVDTEYFEYMRKKSARCAEVLVPNRVGPEFIMGAYVSCAEAQKSLEAAIVVPLAAEQNRSLFFA